MIKREEEEGDKQNQDIQKAVLVDNNDVEMDDVSNNDAQTKITSKSVPMPKATDNDETAKKQKEDTPKEDTILEKKDLVADITATNPERKSLGLFLDACFERTKSFMICSSLATTFVILAIKLEP